MDDARKIGIGLTAGGVLFSVIGIMLFFDKGLLAMGNVRSSSRLSALPAALTHPPLPRAAQLLFLSGITLIIGPSKTYRFFFQKKKARGTSTFLGGMLLVLWGWPVFGILIEAFGFLNLFGDFFPIALGFMRNMPIIGHVLNLPPVRTLTDRFIAKSRLPV